MERCSCDEELEYVEGSKEDTGILLTEEYICPMCEKKYERRVMFDEIACFQDNEVYLEVD